MDEAVKLLSATSQLIACMEQEAELIRAHNLDAIDKLQSHKSAFANSYKAWATALRGNNDLNLDPRTRSELLDATARCEATIQQNMRALRAMRDISDNMLQAIIGAIEEGRTNVTYYDHYGTAKRTRSLNQAARV